MHCPYCQYYDCRVVDKRDSDDGKLIRRRRQCLKCEKRFTTYERIENIDLQVIKRSGRLEQFDRAKLKRGILTALQKRPVTESQVEEIVDEIEGKLLQRKATSVPTMDIGKMVLTRLRKLDKLGYIRFLSVYNEFETLDDFQHELAELQSETVPTK